MIASVKLRYSEKATIFEKTFHLKFDVKFKVEDFLKFCGLLRISELYIERHLDKSCYVRFCLPSFSFVVLALFWCNKCHTNVNILKKNCSVQGMEMIKNKSARWW